MDTAFKFYGHGPASELPRLRALTWAPTASISARQSHLLHLQSPLFGYVPWSGGESVKETTWTNQHTSPGCAFFEGKEEEGSPGREEKRAEERAGGFVEKKNGSNRSGLGRGHHQQLRRRSANIKKCSGRSAQHRKSSHCLLCVNTRKTSSLAKRLRQNGNESITLFLWHFQPRSEARTLMLLLFAGTIFCEFLRFWKNRKIKYPQKFLSTHRTLWLIQPQTAWWFSTLDPWSFSLIVSAFSFLPSRACHHELEKVTFDYIDDRWSFTSETKTLFLQDNLWWRCTMWHVWMT